MKLTIYNAAGAAAGEMEISSDLLETRRGGQAVRDAVVAYLARRRAGTASTLSKGEVAGSNKKPWRQKGTGRARAGYRQSPVWRGGGVAFGPHSRSYDQKINRKVARLAWRRAFSDKLVEGRVKVVEAVSVERPETKLFVGLMKALQVAGPALFVVDRKDRALALASRNVADVEVAGANEVNVYQLLRYPTVVVSKAAMGILQKRLGAKEAGA